MNVDKSDFEKLECEHLLSIIKDREHAIRQLFSTSIALSVGILSAVAGFINTNPESFIKDTIAYIYLLPTTVTIPIFILLGSIRGDLLRAGNYVRVFFDESGSGIRWSTRLNRFRDKVHGESLNPVPLTYWTIAAVCSLFSINAIHSLDTESSLYSYIPIALVFIFQAYAHYQFSLRRSSLGSQHLRAWQKLRDSEASMIMTRNNHDKLL